MDFLAQVRARGFDKSLKSSLRWLAYCVGAVAILILLAIGSLYVSARRSLPQIDGELAVSNLSSQATIERDSLGVPAIRASSRDDLAFATGFVHAQDRFFQMDLLRRSAAGELSALLGASLVPVDKNLRLHRFRSISAEVLNNASAAERALIDAYTKGVNAGLESLRARPWEYLVLRTKPKAWRSEDSVLVAFAMYLSLNDSSGVEEIERAKLKQSLPAELFAFIHPVGTEWDAPIAGRAWRTPAIPGPEIFDIRKGSSGISAARNVPASRENIEGTSTLDPRFWSHRPDRYMPGSNSWAIASTHSSNGAAMLANDMHLGLRLPNVWYQARLIVEAEGDLARDLVGVTLPGLPVLIVGSNSHVAWGYTNSYGDWTDLVIVEPDPTNPSAYLTSEGSEAFDIQRERIEVNGADAIEFQFKTTRWGPLLNEELDGQPLALAWTAHHSRATNLGLLAFERARSVDELLSAANRAGAPVQNIVAADVEGHIGWSVLGQVPLRGSYDTTIPTSWRSGDAGWKGWRDPVDYPRIVDPPTARLWTANARTIDAEKWFEFMGEGGYDLGARGAQIRDALLSDSSVTAQEMSALQTDDRALFLTRWRDLLLEISAGEIDPQFREPRAFVEQWSARASADDVGYRIVRAFRNQVRTDVYGSLIAPARARSPATHFAPSPQFEGPLWAIVTERPQHLLDPRYDSWESALRGSFKLAIDELSEGCAEWRTCTWGAENTLAMRHPLSAALPMISRFIDMPAVGMSGDAAMPRVQSPSFGASERLVVSPGLESEGLFEMPGGAAGHPLSPFYGAGHDQWVHGKPRALRPGEPEHVLRLVLQ